MRKAPMKRDIRNIYRFLLKSHEIVDLDKCFAQIRQYNTMVDTVRMSNDVPNQIKSHVSRLPKYKMPKYFAFLQEYYNRRLKSEKSSGNG